MKIQILILILIIAGVSCYKSELERLVVQGFLLPQEQLIQQIFTTYQPQKGYDSNEYNNFKKNLLMIHEHNKDNQSSYQQEINEFSFMSDEEKFGNFLGAQDCSATVEWTLKEKLLNSKKFQQQNLLQIDDAPSSMDWRNKNVVTPVKDQGSCGSCWAFATTGALESHWALKFGITPTLLSEQQLVDCAGAFNNFGCNGGLPSQAFEYIHYNEGLMSENAYPYTSVDGKCKYNSDQKAAMVPNGSVNITAFDENELLQSVGLKGPTTAAFEVTSDFFQYKSGVYQSSTCSTSPQKVNHAILIVGYGTENGIPYWLCKNSWSSSWGDQGYFKIKRGVNMCGIADCASYPNVY